MMQNWNAQLYAANARFVADYGESVLELLKPRAGENILDLGCGDGALTLKIAATGAKVIGIDASEDMVIAAKKAGVEAYVMAGGEISYRDKFDAVFSNAALHWMVDIEPVLSGVAKALKPSGRFVGEMGGFGNCAAIATALIAVLKNYNIDGAARLPWYFPTAQEFAERLEKHNFKIQSIEIIPRQTLLKTGMRNWLEIFANPFVDGLDETARSKIFDDVTESLKPSLCDSMGNWVADYVRLRFYATV